MFRFHQEQKQILANQHSLGFSGLLYFTEILQKQFLWYNNPAVQKSGSREEAAH